MDMNAVEIVTALERLGDPDEQVRLDARTALATAKPEVVCGWVRNKKVLAHQSAPVRINSALLLGVIGGNGCISVIVDSMRLEPPDGSVALAKLVALTSIRAREPREQFIGALDGALNGCPTGAERLRTAATTWRRYLPPGFVTAVGLRPSQEPSRLGTKSRLPHPPPPVESRAFWVDRHAVIHWWDDHTTEPSAVG
jgi:hypothetical protein